MAKSNTIKQYNPEGVAEFMNLFIEYMKLHKLEFNGSSYSTAKEQVLDVLADELEIPKKDFLVLMSGLEVISDWEGWYMALGTILENVK